MTFEDRLKNYAAQFTLRKNRHEGGLTSKQRRRLLKKDHRNWHAEVAKSCVK